MSTFNETKENQFPKLEQFVPIVARVHGEHHPEFHDVRRIFDRINEKTKAAGDGRPELNDEFARLRVITDNYKVPGDACEAYEAVYRMLAEVDQAYGE